jgi:uncharacterized protein YlzI (FlbEa/FlbD family)
MRADELVVLTRLDGEPCWILKSAIVEFGKDVDRPAGTRITLLSGFQIVKEPPDAVAAKLLD